MRNRKVSAETAFSAKRATMMAQSGNFTSGPEPNTVIGAEGRVVTVPPDWSFFAPGDAALTRRVKAAGNHFVVVEKKGRKLFTRGVWAPAATIEKVRTELAAERSSDSFAKKQQSAARRREKAQAEYVDQFYESVLTFLRFHPLYTAMAGQLAQAVTAHATPVGSGTVARTERIPVEKRAEAAVIAWMRHQTTGYDEMTVRRIKGERRAVRRQLAQQSQVLLSRYRKGEPILDHCPLRAALERLKQEPVAEAPNETQDGL